MGNTYLIMRKVKYFDFDEPRFFIGSTNPNRNLLEIGAKVIIEKEWNAEIRFIGHAEIEVIKENLNATDNRKGEQIVELTNFEKFFPPRIKNAEIRSLLNMLPGYRWFDSIRPINKEIFEKIVKFCSQKMAKEQLIQESRFSAYDSLALFMLEDESDRLEFKSTLMTPLNRESLTKIEQAIEKEHDLSQRKKLKEALIREENRLIKEVEHSIIKTLAAFANSEGGTLFVGVDDNKNVCGIELDYPALENKQGWDGWLQHLKNLISSYIGNNIFPNVQVRKIDIDRKTVARIDALASPEPIFVKPREKNGSDEEFFVRHLNTTQRLTAKEMANYIGHHWHSTDSRS